MENQYALRVRKLRDDPKIHYNCAQSVMLALAPECGISRETALGMCAHFGGGMKMGATCGAITGGLMALGLLGGGDDAYRSFMTALRQRHEGRTNCSDLLAANAKAGGSRKEHCDGMVQEAVALVVQIMGLEDGTGETGPDPAKSGA